MQGTAAGQHSCLLSAKRRGACRAATRPVPSGSRGFFLPSGVMLIATSTRRRRAHAPVRWLRTTPPKISTR